MPLPGLTEQETKKSAAQECEEECVEIEKLANEVEARVIENPEVLERILHKPQIMAMVSESFKGPVPSPKMLEGYEKIVPGLADRLVKLTEEEQRHRHAWMDSTKDLTAKKDWRGQWMGYSLSVMVLAMAFHFAYKGNFWFAGTLVTFDLVSLASVFAIGHLVKSKPSKNSSD